MIDPVHFLSAEDRYPPHSDFPDHTAAEAVVFRFHRHHEGKQAGQLKGWPDGIHPPHVVARARVDHGRWLVDCPFGCNTSQYASRVDRRTFCTQCANGGTGRWAAVEWPDDVDLIEAALSRVPIESMRNWNPGETVDDLLEQLGRAGF